MVVGFPTTYAISAYHHQGFELESSSGDVYSIQHYVIKFVSDLRKFKATDMFFNKLPSDNHNIQIIAERNNLDDGS